MDTLTGMQTQESYTQKMLNEGVCVFKNQISSKNIQSLKAEINRIKHIVMTKIDTMERPLKVYSDIAERHLGRLDYRCGFTADIFHDVAAPIVEIVHAMSPQIDFR